MCLEKCVRCAARYQEKQGSERKGDVLVKQRPYIISMREREIQESLGVKKEE